MNSRKQLKRRFNYLLKNLSILLLNELIEMVENEITKNKRQWVRKWIDDRNETGGSALLLKQLRFEDPAEYKLAMRMSPQNFDELLSMISSSIQRHDTFMRDALPAKIKLEITLTFLASGMYYRFLSHFYRVSKPAISQLIPEVCWAIYTALKTYIKIPEREVEWKIIEDGFNTKWNFPSCYGAIDGKHIIIKAPPNSGSEFYNYKKTNSTVLLALVDHDYCFSYIDVGANGNASDGGVFKNSSLYRRLEDGLLPTNGVIVGDAAFPLKNYLLKPYPGTQLSTAEKVFNYRLSRTRRISENAFGILVSRFRVFEKAIPTHLDTVDAIVCAACALHNWLRKRSSSYITSNCVDREDNDGQIIEGTWRSEINPLLSISEQQRGNHSMTAKEKRDLYRNFFMTAGSVPWQLDRIH
ncbi:unnamed protein product [Pieris macdunnoughi]|uniref:DDE Tnp4 domain-containing protein n=1 Tax=Pieris macdunnoughi TaxID=345717 RepID=A0A821XPW4_9NEOP|nr:unnamed protein product [Pieris macdunnoughi]